MFRLPFWVGQSPEKTTWTTCLWSKPAFWKSSMEVWGGGVFIFIYTVQLLPCLHFLGAAHLPSCWPRMKRYSCQPRTPWVPAALEAGEAGRLPLLEPQGSTALRHLSLRLLAACAVRGQRSAVLRCQVHGHLLQQPLGLWCTQSCHLGGGGSQGSPCRCPELGSDPHSPLPVLLSSFTAILYL